MADADDLEGFDATGEPRVAITDMEAPEADALEQARSASPDDIQVVHVSRDPEAPEADILEQARVVTFDEEE